MPVSHSNDTSKRTNEMQKLMQTFPTKVAFIAPREVSRVTSDLNARETASFRVRLSARGAMKANFGGRINARSASHTLHVFFARRWSSSVKRFVTSVIRLFATSLPIVRTQ